MLCQVRNINSRPSKKRNVPSSAEMRFLVTVLMGFSSDQFGGPEAVVEPADEEPRDSGPDEERKKGFNGTGGVGVPHPLRASTRTTRAAVARDDLASSAVPTADKATTFVSVAEGLHVELRSSEALGKKWNGDAPQGPSLHETPDDMPRLCAVPASEDKLPTELAEGHGVSSIGHLLGIEADAVDCALPCRAIEEAVLVQDKLAAMEGIRAHQQVTCHESDTPIAKVDEVHPDRVNGKLLPILNGQHKCNSADAQSSLNADSNACLSNAANRTHDASAAAIRRGSSCMLSSLEERQVAARRKPCACAAQNGSNGCSNRSTYLQGTDEALYAAELQVVLANPSVLPIHHRAPPAELVAMAGTTSVRIPSGPCTHNWLIHNLQQQF